MSSNNENKEHSAEDQDQRVLQLWITLTGNIDQETTLPGRERAVNPDETIVVNTPDMFQKVVTPRRVEILDVLVESAQPVDIKTLSRAVNRGTETVRDDVELLSSHGIIEVTEIDNMMTSYLPYDTVRVDVDFPIIDSDPTEDA